MASNDTFTARVPKEVIEDSIYTKWEKSLDGSPLVRVQAARDKIESEGVVTGAKDLGRGLYEKKWNSGLRLYFAVIEQEGVKTLLLLGSGKGREQTKAISESRRSLQNYKVINLSLVKYEV